MRIETRREPTRTAHPPYPPQRPQAHARPQPNQHAKQEPKSTPQLQPGQAPGEGITTTSPSASTILNASANDPAQTPAAAKASANAHAASANGTPSAVPSASSAPSVSNLDTSGATSSASASPSHAPRVSSLTARFYFPMPEDELIELVQTDAEQHGIEYDRTDYANANVPTSLFCALFPGCPHVVQLIHEPDDTWTVRPVAGHVHERKVYDVSRAEVLDMIRSEAMAHQIEYRDDSEDGDCKGTRDEDDDSQRHRVTLACATAGCELVVSAHYAAHAGGWIKNTYGRHNHLFAAYPAMPASALRTELAMYAEAEGYAYSPNRSNYLSRVLLDCLHAGCTHRVQFWQPERGGAWFQEKFTPHTHFLVSAPITHTKGAAGLTQGVLSLPFFTESAALRLAREAGLHPTRRAVDALFWEYLKFRGAAHLDTAPKAIRNDMNGILWRAMERPDFMAVCGGSREPSANGANGGVNGYQINGHVPSREQETEGHRTNGAASGHGPNGTAEGDRHKENANGHMPNGRISVHQPVRSTTNGNQANAWDTSIADATSAPATNGKETNATATTITVTIDPTSELETTNTNDTTRRLETSTIEKNTTPTYANGYDDAAQNIAAGSQHVPISNTHREAPEPESMEVPTPSLPAPIAPPPELRPPPPSEHQEKVQEQGVHTLPAEASESVTERIEPPPLLQKPAVVLDSSTACGLVHSSKAVTREENEMDVDMATVAEEGEAQTEVATEAEPRSKPALVREREPVLKPELEPQPEPELEPQAEVELDPGSADVSHVVETGMGNEEADMDLDMDTEADMAVDHDDEGHPTLDDQEAVGERNGDVGVKAGAAGERLDKRIVDQDQAGAAETQDEMAAVDAVKIEDDTADQHADEAIEQHAADEHADEEIEKPVSAARTVIRERKHVPRKIRAATTATGVQTDLQVSVARARSQTAEAAAQTHDDALPALAEPLPSLADTAVPVDDPPPLPPHLAAPSRASTSSSTAIESESAGDTETRRHAKTGQHPALEALAAGHAHTDLWNDWLRRMEEEQRWKAWVARGQARSRERRKRTEG